MVAAVLQPSDFCHPFRRPPRPLQGRLAASLAAAGLSGGCRSIWRQVWPLQGRLAASLAIAGPFGDKFGRCRSIWRQVLAAAGPLQGRYTHPSFNGAAAVEYALCYLQV